MKIQHKNLILPIVCFLALMATSYAACPPCVGSCNETESAREDDPPVPTGAPAVCVDRESFDTVCVVSAGPPEVLGSTHVVISDCTEDFTITTRWTKSCALEVTPSDPCASCSGGGACSESRTETDTWETTSTSGCS